MIQHFWCKICKKVTMIQKSLDRVLFVHLVPAPHQISFQSYLISRPFSCKDFSLGSGGTFPTQALRRCPPTEIVQEPQSPLLLMASWGVSDERRFTWLHCAFANSLSTRILRFNTKARNCGLERTSSFEVSFLAIVWKNSHLQRWSLHSVVRRWTRLKCHGSIDHGKK